MTETKIEWCNKTWNPIRGCSLVSAGCRSCYAMKQAHRFSGPGKAYEGLTKMTPAGPQWTGKVRLVPEFLDQPLRWRRPSRVFVNSMSDLFHEAVPDEFIDKVFAVMAQSRKHTFQILTKRPERMCAYMGGARERVADEMHALGRSIESSFSKHQLLTCYAKGGPDFDAAFEEWPKRNVWMGASVENQEQADKRIPLLLQTPAAVRFISAEPLLGPIDLGYRGAGALLVDGAGDRMDPQKHAPHQVDWVIVGGESGPGARPCDVGWIRSIVEQCREAQVSVFCKQLGSKPITYGHTEATGGDWPAGTRLHVGETMQDPYRAQLRDPKGGDPSEWPVDLRVREFPETVRQA